MEPTKVESVPARIVVLDGAELGALVRAAVADAIREAMPAQIRHDDDGALKRRDATARLLGVSIATVDRLTREGMPHEIVGNVRRYDLAACREWLAARGRKPTTQAAKKKTGAIDIDALASRNGLRVAS